MIPLFDQLAQALGPEVYAVLCVGALLEYVFPPFPGDTIVLLGGVLAVRGERPWGWVFAAVTLGSVLGAAVDYLFGAWLGHQVTLHPERVRFFGVPRERVLRLRERVRDRAGPFVLLNRFLPAFRALIFVAAGAAGLPFGRVMLLGACSALAWNVLVLSVGYGVGGNLEALQAFFSGYHKVALGVVVVALAVVAGGWWWRRRHALAG